MRDQNLKRQFRNNLWIKTSLILGTVCILIFIVGIRIHDASVLQKKTNENSILMVQTIQATLGPANEEIVLPGTVQAWHEAPLYARTNGYVKDWFADIGTPVKKNEILAVLEIPEVLAQLRQAKADLAVAIANSKLADATALRWQELVKQKYVSNQEADEKVYDAAAKKLLIASAQANYDHLKELVAFKHIVAPFDGIVTFRNTDKGVLINAGTGTGTELFRVAQVDKLRVYVQVPQRYVLAIQPKLIAALHFSQYPNKVFHASFLQTANALDPNSRTLLVEFVLINQNNEVMPGEFTEAHLKIPKQTNIFILPVNTLIFRAAGIQVATVDMSTHRIKLKSVKIGIDLGSKVEIISGLMKGDVLVVNPPDSLVDGEVVKTK